MAWVIVGLCIATGISVVTIVMAICWERHKRKVVFNRLQEQLRLQEIAHHEAEIKAALDLKVVDIKWPRAVK